MQPSVTFNTNTASHILIEQRGARLGARRFRRIERKIGKEAFPRRVSDRDLLELFQIPNTHCGIFVFTLHERLIPFGTSSIWPPQGAAGRAKLSSKAQSSGQCPLAAAGAFACSSGIWADSGKQLQDAKARDTIAWVLCLAQKCDDIFDVGGFQELEAAKLHESDVPSRQLDLKQGSHWSWRSRPIEQTSNEIAWPWPTRSRR
jgi:hypothetical protein